MEFEGTKGDWVSDDKNGYKCVQDEKGNLIAYMSAKPGYPHKENMNLIAAGPNLLEALQETQKDLKIMKGYLEQEEKINVRFFGMPKAVQKWIERNEKAIKKALDL